MKKDIREVDVQRFSRISEMSLDSFLEIILKRKITIAIMVLITVATAIVISLCIRPSFRAEVLVMQVGGKLSGPSNVLSQLGGLAPALGLGSVMGGSTNLDQFVTVLRSKTLAEKIIGKYDLLKVFYPDDWDERNGRWKISDIELQKRLDAAIQSLRTTYTRVISSRQDNTIKISVEMPTAKLAADVANGYAVGFQEIVNDNSFTMAKRNRQFIEEQLEQNKRELLESGKELNEFYKGKMISSVESKVDVPITVSDVSNKEKVVELYQQKKTLEEGIEGYGIVKDVPQQVYLQYLTIRKNLLTQLNGMLSQQYMMAKIEESRDDMAFQVVDPAKEPIQRFKPRRKLIVITAFVVSLFVGIMAAFLLEYIEGSSIKQRTFKGGI